MERIPAIPRGAGATKSNAANVRTSLEKPALASALAALDGRAADMVEGPAIWNAVSNHARIPVTTLREQRSATKWNYGELLVANSLAMSTGNSFAAIVALRAETKGWSQLARKLRIDPGSVAARVAAADVSLKKASMRGRATLSDMVDRTSGTNIESGTGR